MSLNISYLNAALIFLFLFPLFVSSFSPDEWYNDQISIENHQLNEFRFKSPLESSRNSYGTKLLSSESSNYQPVIADVESIGSNHQSLVATPQQKHLKQWPDPFDPQPHVPIGSQIPTPPENIKPSNDPSIPVSDTRSPLKLPNNEPQTLNTRYMSPNEGELGTSRPKKEKMTVDEIFLGVFSPVPFNGTWLTDHELMYHDSSNNLVLLNLRNDSVSLLVPNTTFVSEKCQFQISPIYFIDFTLPASMKLDTNK